MLAGEGADAFSVSAGLEQAEPAWFFTERRWGQLVQTLTDRGLPIPERPAGAPPPPDQAASLEGDDHRFGTVGVVAVDTRGRIAAGTSTGGTTAKRWGRIGDAPVIGAGTWAGRGCAVSATGTGEYFIRLTVARDICGLNDLNDMPIAEAAEAMISELSAIGGDGGVIALTADGSVAFSMNTSGMYRGWADQDSPPAVAIYADEDIQP
jgi:beta-aspartyl-peptidase (threonine type)